MKTSKITILVTFVVIVIVIALFYGVFSNDKPVVPESPYVREVPTGNALDCQPPFVPGEYESCYPKLDKAD